MNEINNTTTVTGEKSDEEKRIELEALEKAAAEQKAIILRFEQRLEGCTAQLTAIDRSLAEAEGAEHDARLRALAVSEEEIIIAPVDVTKLKAQRHDLSIINDELEKRLAEHRRQLAIFVGGVVRIDTDLNRAAYVQAAVDAITDGQMQDNGASILAFFRSRGVETARANKLTDRVFVALARQRMAS